MVEPVGTIHFDPLGTIVATNLSPCFPIQLICTQTSHDRHTPCMPMGNLCSNGRYFSRCQFVGVHPSSFAGTQTDVQQPPAPH